MRNRWLIFSLLVLTGSILIGCGSVAEPRPTFEPTETFDYSVRVTPASIFVKGGDSAVAALPTETPEPTATNMPLPTDTPIPSPSAIPPTETPIPTEEPVAEVAGDPINGQVLYTQQCVACHTLDGTIGVGPSFMGLGERAGSIVEGYTAYDYIYESIVEPGAYVVDGYVDGIMLQNFGTTLSATDLDDLIAYLLSL